MNAQLKIPGLSRVTLIPKMSWPALFDTTIRLLGLVLVLFAVFLTSRWLTELTAPRPVAKLPSMPSAPLENNLKMVSKLFGTSAARSQSLDALQLAGVFTGSNGGGFATFRTRSGAISVFIGEEVEPGVRLKQIERDRVIILSAGAQKELRLSQGSGQPSSPIGQTAASPPQQATPSIPQGVETNQQASSNRRAARPQEELK